MQIEYFEIPEMPGQNFFRCERRKASIRLTVCLNMWTSSQSKDADERYLSCRGCQVGAKHAGATEATLSPLFAAAVCGRCGSGATRLIGGHLCVSCYNRGREWLIGRNARGNKPSTLPPLWRLAIRYRTGGRVKVREMPHALDVLELITATLRDEPKQATFALHVRRPALVQADLFA